MEDAELDELCVCGHRRRHHMGHGRPGAYDTCVAAYQGKDSVCPCMRFVKAEVKR